MTHQPPVYIVQMLPTSSLPNQTTICNHSASAFCDKIPNQFAAFFFANCPSQLSSPIGSEGLYPLGSQLSPGSYSALSCQLEITCLQGIQLYCCSPMANTSVCQIIRTIHQWVVLLANKTRIRARFGKYEGISSGLVHWSMARDVDFGTYFQ